MAERLGFRAREGTPHDDTGAFLWDDPYPALDLAGLTADVGPPITYRAVPRDQRPAASPCSYAYAVAEARDEIPSFVKMLLR